MRYFGWTFIIAAIGIAALIAYLKFFSGIAEFGLL